MLGAAALTTLTGPVLAQDGTGLRGDYYHWDAAIGAPPERSEVFVQDNYVTSRLDRTVDHNFDADSSRPGGVAGDQFAVQWVGQVLAPTAGDYTFCTASDDGSRLWISSGNINPDSDTPVVDNWFQQGETELCAESPMTLAAGTKYNLIMEHEEAGGGASARLRWILPDGTKQIIPTRYLFPPASPDTVAPPAVADLAATAVAGGVTLTFTAPKDTGTGSSGNATGYEIRYSTAPITANNFRNATLFGGIPQPSAGGAKESVTLTGLQPLENYYIAVISTDAGLNTSALSNVVQATTPAPAPLQLPATGLLVNEYNSIGGTAVANLRTSGKFPGAPDRQYFIGDGVQEKAEEGFEIPADTHDNYGVLVQGYIVPETTGEYTFGISADDGAELWLSTDENPANMRQIASVLTWTGIREWEKEENQTSEPIRLEAGKRYYVEALVKEGGGGDNLAVRWGLNGNMEETPIEDKFLKPYEAPPVGRIRGNIVDASGNPSANVMVTLTSSGGTFNATSDANGMYSILAPAGSYTVGAGDTLAARYQTLPTAPVTVTVGQAAQVANVVAYPHPWDEGNADAAKSDDFNGTTLDAKWTSMNIGTDDDGSAKIENNQLAVAAGGADIWNTADSFHYLFQRMNGDFWATLRVVAVPDNQDWELAGLMVRKTTDADSAHAFNQISPRHAIQNKRRPTAGSASDNIDLAADTAGNMIVPAYVKIRRVGNKIAYYWSKDPATGPVHLGSVREIPDFANTPELLVGIAATSHTEGILDEGFLFDDFRIGPISDTLPPPPGKPGDVTGDGVVDLKDATLALQIAVGNVTPTPAQTAAGDIVGTGNGISIPDVTRILGIAVGLIPGG